MNLVYLAAVIAVCSAAKLDRTYLPPDATAAGGSTGDIQTPLLRDSFNGPSEFPKGAYDNEFEGVVVEAVAPGIRASGPAETGLGGPRISYGSMNSKVGVAAFKTNQNGVQVPIAENVRGDQVESQTLVNVQQGFNTDLNRVVIRPQSALDRIANIVRYENNRGAQSYNYAYETENGITVEESGALNNGVEARGGYSYTGDDGRLYKVTYTAGEGGYQPIGDHLPTPPPIPKEILRSLDQNAREAAAGLIDDGSYDASKYNTGEDYTKSDGSFGDNNNIRQQITVNKPDSGADTSGSYTSQNGQSFGNIDIREKISTPTYDMPKDTTVASNAFNYFQNNKLFKPTAATETGTQNSFTYENQNVIYNKKETSNEGSSSDDYSRPINFDSSQSNQEMSNSFGNRPSLISTNSNIRPSVSLNSENSVVGSFSSPESFSGYQFNKFSQSSNNVVPTQSSSQIVNGYPNNVELNRESLQSEAQNNFNSFNNIHSTIIPSTVLTTPFEGNPNGPENISPIVLPDPTQASYTTLTTSQNNENPQFSKVTSQQEFQQFADTDKTKISGTYQISDNAYYYNQPSKPLNTIKATAPTFVTGHSHFTNGYQSSVSTKYPQPPTVASVLINDFTGSKQNQYSNAPQISSIGSHLRPFTKYPQPPVITQIAVLPTNPTSQIGNKFPIQYPGITQASVSPFPSTVTFTGSNSNLQQPETSFPNTFPQQTTFGQSFNSGNVGNQEQPQYNKMNSQSILNQQNNEEIYEYKKPEELLPTETDEIDVTKSTENYSQFGQKIQSSMLNQPLLIDDQRESNSQKDDTQSIQSTPSQFDSQNLQSIINLQETNANDKEMVAGHSGNIQTFGQEPITQKFPTFLQEKQPTEDYKNPFELSSRIRPCCQGTRTLTTGKAIHNDLSKPLQQTGLSQSEVNSQFGFHAQQNPQANSSFQRRNGDEFSGPRRPPHFDEVSGYNY